MIAVVKSSGADGKQRQQQGYHADHPENIPATFGQAVLKSGVGMTVPVVATIFVGAMIFVILETLMTIIKHMTVARDTVQVIAVTPCP